MDVNVVKAESCDALECADIQPKEEYIQPKEESVPTEAEDGLKRKLDNDSQAVSIGNDISDEPLPKVTKLDDEIKTELVNIIETTDDSAVQETPAEVGSGDVPSNAAPVVLDPLAYTKAEEFTSEIYKIQIHNLPKCGFTDLKKRLISLGLKPHKMKKPASYVAYICFRCEEDRVEALKKVEGHVWRGRTLEAKEAAPLEDPFLLKKQDNSVTSGSQDPMTDEEAQKKLKDNVVPLWNVDYNQQLEEKTKRMRNLLKKMTHHFQVREQFREMKSWKEDGMPCTLLPIIPSPVTSEYRNKNEFTIGYSHDGSRIKVGFRFGLYKNGTTCVGDCDGLSVVKPAAVAVVKSFERFVCESKWKPYLQQSGDGHWHTLTVRSFDLGDVMAMVDFHPRKLDKVEIEQAKESIREFFMNGEGKAVDIKSFYFRLYAKPVVKDVPKLQLIYGEPYVYETLLGLRFRISPEAFFQVNSKATEQLYSLIGDWCQASSSSTVLDICCGTGTIGLSLAKNVRQVLGVEMCEPAVEDAKVNAQLNGISNIKYYCSKVEDKISKMLQESAQRPSPSATATAVPSKTQSSTLSTSLEEAQQPTSTTGSIEEEQSVKSLQSDMADPGTEVTETAAPSLTPLPSTVTTPKNDVIAVVDPPRAGLHKNVIKTLRRNEDIERLIYVSCNAESAVENFLDLIRPCSSKLRGEPFVMEKAIPVDLFPGTKHCELVLLFTRSLKD